MIKFDNDLFSNDDIIVANEDSNYQGVLKMELEVWEAF